MTRTRILSLVLSIALLNACVGVTTLRCSVDGESSFVELINMPQEIAAQSRHYTELCGFAYDQGVINVQAP